MEIKDLKRENPHLEYNVELILSDGCSHTFFSDENIAMKVEKEFVIDGRIFNPYCNSHGEEFIYANEIIISKVISHYRRENGQDNS